MFVNRIGRLLRDYHITSSYGAHIYRDGRPEIKSVRLSIWDVQLYAGSAERIALNFGADSAESARWFEPANTLLRAFRESAAGMASTGSRYGLSKSS
jgi:hypothetical protein